MSGSEIRKQVEMTAKERVLSALQFGEVDRVPCLPYVRDMAIKYAGFRYRDVLGDIDKYVHTQVKAARDFHIDGVWDWGIAHFFSELTGGKVLFFDDDQPASEPPKVNSQQLLTKLEKLDYTHSPNLVANLKVVSKLKEAMGPDYPVIGYLLMPFRFAAEVRGIQQIMLDLILEPDVVRQIQEQCINLGTSYAEALMTAGADMVWLTNPLANSSCISREHFEKLVHPYCQMLIQKLKERGIKSIYHICGDWRDRLDLVVNEGTDCLYVDKGNIAEIKRATGSKVCIMGNVDVIGTLLEDTPQQVAEETTRCLEKGAPGGGFILSGSCGVPRDVPVENLSAMTETCRKFDPNTPSS